MSKYSFIWKTFWSVITLSKRVWSIISIFSSVISLISSSTSIKLNGTLCIRKKEFLKILILRNGFLDSNIKKLCGIRTIILHKERLLSIYFGFLNFSGLDSPLFFRIVFWIKFPISPSLAACTNPLIEYAVSKNLSSIAAGNFRIYHVPILQKWEFIRFYLCPWKCLGFIWIWWRRVQ